MSQAVPAGIYPDPENPSRPRYWDGSTWGPILVPQATPIAVAPVASVATDGVHASRPRSSKRGWVTALVLVLFLGAGLAAYQGKLNSDLKSQLTAAKATASSLGVQLKQSQDATAQAQSAAAQAQSAATQATTSAAAYRSAGQSLASCALSLSTALQDLNDGLIISASSELDDALISCQTGKTLFEAAGG